MKLRPALQRFAEKMEETLRRHDDVKGSLGWKTMTPCQLWEKLEEELYELRLEFSEGQNDIGLKRECVDVANVVMMLFDIS